jgi:hypothetical protein
VTVEEQKVQKPRSSQSYTVTTNEEDSRAARLRNWMTSRLSDSDYVTTDQEDSRAADAELDDLRPRDTQECPVKMVKLCVCMRAKAY